MCRQQTKRGVRNGRQLFSLRCSSPWPAFYSAVSLFAFGLERFCTRTRRCRCCHATPLRCWRTDVMVTIFFSVARGEKRALFVVMLVRAYRTPTPVTRTANRAKNALALVRPRVCRAAPSGLLLLLRCRPWYVVCRLPAFYGITLRISGIGSPFPAEETLRADLSCLSGLVLLRLLPPVEHCRLSWHFHRCRWCGWTVTLA